ncbi:hypothetical protein MVEN_00560600 [Mycena venus]|uniref:F-box domain-containing protein n=1 Tax=Mycena venus TaxID=2733690 RepID=A0A8H6YNX1_9AGAR|nr:hypothetical protein MVEN_00560600 [Mycena venus]
MDLNVDVWLYILTLVPLRDAISFTWVSREFRSLTREKTFWISLLSATRTIRPLPCPDDEDLTKCNISDLADMVFRVIRLERNWARSRPRVRAIETIQLGNPDHRILHAIPGTPLLVVHSGFDGTATCWNIETKSALHSVYIGCSVFHVSLVSRRNKAYSIALLVTNDPTEDYTARPSYLAVLTIQTASPSPRIDVPFRRELEPGFTFGQLFLNPWVVGLLRVFEMEKLEIVAFNRYSGACRVIHTDTVHDSKMGAFLDDSLYIVNHRNDTSSNVFTCPSYLLPYNDSEEPETHITETLDWDDRGIRFWGAIDASYAGLEAWFETLDAVTATPVRGAALTTLHYINVDEEAVPRALNIRFWSFKDSDTPLSRRLYPAYSLNVRGMIATVTNSSRPRYLMANSDISILLLASYDDTLGLLLVQYDPSAFSSTVRQLEIPSPPDLNTISSIAVDDHRGTVMLIDEDGVLYSVSYA